MNRVEELDPHTIKVLKRTAKVIENGVWLILFIAFQAALGWILFMSPFGRWLNGY